MDLHKINDKISVAPQLMPEDIEAAKDAGFVTIICNRPDYEGPGQPEASSIATAAGKNELKFVYLPLAPGQLTKKLIDDFGAALDKAEGPVLAYCKSGTRSATLWALSQACNEEPSALLAAAQNAGYDLNNIKPMLEQLRA